LLDVNSNRLSYVDLVIDLLKTEKLDVKEAKVAHEFQKSGDIMLKFAENVIRIIPVEYLSVKGNSNYHISEAQIKN